MEILMHSHVLMCMYSAGTVPKGGKPNELYSLSVPLVIVFVLLSEFLFNYRLVLVRNKKKVADENYEEKLSSNKMNTGFHQYKNHKSGRMRHTGPSSEALLLNSRTSLSPVGSDLKWNTTDQSRYACVVVNYGLVIC